MEFQLGDEVTYAQCIAAATKVHFEGKVENRSWIDEILVFQVNEEVYVVINGMVIAISSFAWIFDQVIDDCEKRLVSRDLSVRNETW